MLSEEKIKKMIRLAEYEQGIGKTDLRRVSYMKGDFIRIRMLKTMVSVMIAFFLTAGLVSIYKLEYILKNALALPFGKIILLGGGTFFILLLVSWIITWHMSSKVYEESEVRAKEYYKTLQELSELYEKEERGQEDNRL